MFNELLDNGDIWYNEELAIAVHDFNTSMKEFDKVMDDLVKEGVVGGKK